MRSVTDLGTTGLTAALFIFGVAAAFGNALGGRAADRFGSIRMMRTLLVGLVILFLVIAVSARMLPSSIEGPVILAEIAVWGAMGWAFYPAQASRMVMLAPNAAVVALSLNASALYFGVALGGAIGRARADLGDADRAWALRALCGLVALGLLSLSLQAGGPPVAGWRCSRRSEAVKRFSETFSLVDTTKGSIILRGRVAWPT